MKSGTCIMLIDGGVLIHNSARNLAEKSLFANAVDYEVVNINYEKIIKGKMRFQIYLHFKDGDETSVENFKRSMNGEIEVY